MTAIPDPLSLYRDKKEVIKSNEYIFKRVLVNIIQKVKEENIRSTRMKLVTEIPSSPSYVLEDCAVYIKKHLKQNGYIVKLVKPQHIFIDWNTLITREARAREALKELVELYPFIKVAKE